MAQQGRVKPYSLRPYDPSLNPGTNQYLDWVTQSINWLIGLNTPTKPGLPAVQDNLIDPTSPQFISLGSRPQSITTAMSFVASTTSITFYWDGTNGSMPLQIYRDDGTVTSPIYGNQVVSGLATTTKYYFFPYYNEALGKVLWVLGGVGAPPYASLTITPTLLQQQYLRGHIPLALGLGSTGVTTGSGGGSGGGGGGGGGGGRQLL